MKLSSLGFRLFLLSFLSILLALVATTFVLNSRFHIYFVNRIYLELQQHVEQLATNITIDTDGDVRVDPLSNARFNTPFSGHYWQVILNDGNQQSSRSLWGGKFEVPDDRPPGVQFRALAKSPVGTDLFVIGWPISAGEGSSRRNILLSVAIDTTEVVEAELGFRNFLISWLAIMFTGLLLAAWAQVRIGLAPLKLLRKKIATIRVGSDTRLVGHFPTEVKPLVKEVNELLDLHEKSLKVARSRASDLAHGLKTPLTVMRVLAEDLASSGQTEQSDEMETQISTMHQFIERELARVSTNIVQTRKSPAANIINRMMKNIKKLPRGRELEWSLDVPEYLASPFDEHELSELVGNLLDNARKWAKSTVHVSAKNLNSDRGWIKFSDDGPGIKKPNINSVLARGGRLDEATPGTGIGLSIVTDLVSQKNGFLEFSDSPNGGLTISINW